MLWLDQNGPVSWGKIHLPNTRVTNNKVAVFHFQGYGIMLTGTATATSVH